jgi:hypothetical protein
MRTNDYTQQGSVLLTTFLSITILSLICATSLYVTSQNSTGGMLTASWQQSLTAAESGVDLGVRALNTSDWSNWRQTSQSGTTLPVTEPSPASSYNVASSGPDPSHYNFLPSAKCTVPMSGEGALSTATWVTVDTAGMSSTQQWYRIRSVGRAYIAGPVRVSMNKLDGNLRNTLAMKFSRKESNNTGAAVNGTTVLAGPTRTIEVVMQPVTSGGWGRGITLRGSINMSGGGVIDSYDSSNAFKSTGGLYDITKRQSHGDVGTLNSASSDLKSTYVYGSLGYSGVTAVKNATNVQGQITTPFAATITDATSPGYTPTAGQTYAAGSPPFTTVTSGTKNNPVLVKVNGNFTVPGGKTLTIKAANNGADNNYISIWVTGDYTTSGSGTISQETGVKTTWYIGGDITTSGDSYNNASGAPSAVNFVGYGPSGSKVTVSGSGVFIGTMNAPNYDTTISGSGGWSGALLSNTLLISGGASFHFDEALAVGGATGGVGNYAFASWFEDNSDPARIIAY